MPTIYPINQMVADWYKNGDWPTPRPSTEEIDRDLIDFMADGCRYNRDEVRAEMIRFWDRESPSLADRLGLPTDDEMDAARERIENEYRQHHGDDGGFRGRAAFTGWLRGRISIARNRALSIKEEVPQ